MSPFDLYFAARVAFADLPDVRIYTRTGDEPGAGTTVVLVWGLLRLYYRVSGASKALERPHHARLMAERARRLWAEEDTRMHGAWALEARR